MVQSLGNNKSLPVFVFFILFIGNNIKAQSITPSLDKLIIKPDMYYDFDDERYDTLYSFTEEPKEISLDTLRISGDTTLFWMYDTKDSSYVTHGAYCNGKPCGLLQVTLKGKLQVRISYRDGLKNGEYWRTYGGNLIETKNYKDGKLDGQRITYINDSTCWRVIRISHYKEGRKVGIEYQMNMGGASLQTVIMYKNKNKNPLTVLYSGGEIYVQGYVDREGRDHGKFIIYAVDGSVLRTEVWKHGMRIRTSSADKELRLP